MKKTLVLFAHPYFEHSKANAKLIECYQRMGNVSFRDLYQDYPDFHIQPFRERKRIVNYSRIVFHFPLIWFGMPPLLKLWIDEVFDMRWINDEHFNILSDKDVIIVTTVGGRESSYLSEGKYKVGVDELLSGLRVSLDVNDMDIKKTFTIYNADNLDEVKLDELTDQLEQIISSS